MPKLLSVSRSFFQLCDCTTAITTAVGFPRVAFRFGERHFLGGRASVSEQTTEGLVQTVRLTVEREPGRRHGVPHPS
ncbi:MULTISPECIES: hypothetical protein [Bradyrhizobium]|nr:MULTISPECIES: hypothetical protein [Bradyrhizobium]